MTVSVNAASSLIVEREGGVVTLVLNRPAKKNAINMALWEELRSELRLIAESAVDRVVVLTGAGGNFCSGADLWEEGQEDRHPIVRMRRIAETVVLLHNLPQPTIACVPGVAVGVGLSLVMACDLAIASEEARLSAIFHKRGLAVDGGGTWLLPRVLGVRRAKEVAFFADMISGLEAEKLGLVNRAVPLNELDAVVADWAGRLAEGPPLAVSMTKRLMNESMGVSLPHALEAEGLANSVNWVTDDAREALDAFTGNRLPVFHGR